MVPFCRSCEENLFAAKQPGVEPELDLVGKELRLISARSAHRLPMQVRHLERNPCLALLEGIEIGERYAAAEAMLGLFGLLIQRRGVDRQIRESGGSGGNRECAGVFILLLVTVHVPARDRQKIIDDDAWGGLEFERRAQRAAYRLTSI